MLMLYNGGESIGDNEVDGGGGVGGKDVYSGRAEPVLVSLSDSHSEDEAISISDNRYSSYSTYTATNYFYQPITALRKI